MTGFIPRGNQVETFGNDSNYENPRLCGFPLSKRCTIDEVLESSQEIEVVITVIFLARFNWVI